MHLTSRFLKDLFSTNIPIYSVIVFGREATLKVLTDIPDHCRVCTQSNISTTINSLTQIHPNAINAQEIAYAYALIQQDQIDPTAIIRTEHIDEVQMFNIFVRSGHVRGRNVTLNTGSLRGAGHNSYYWSATTYPNATDAYYIHFSSTNVNQSGYNSRFYGFLGAMPKHVPQLQTALL